MASETRKSKFERFTAIVAEPEFLDVLCDRVSEGETLSNICREYGVKFRWMYAWLNDEEYPDRKAKYTESENARDALSKEDLIGQLHSLANTDVRDMFDASGMLLPVHKMPSHIAKAISSIDMVENERGEVTKKVRFVDRGQMIGLGGRRHRMFVDRVETTGQMSLEQAVLESTKPRE